MAEQIRDIHKERLATFTFSQCGIEVGEKVVFYKSASSDPGPSCIVVDDKHVEYNDEVWSLTALAKHLLDTKNSIAGPKYYKYKGEWLDDLRR